MTESSNNPYSSPDTENKATKPAREHPPFFQVFSTSALFFLLFVVIAATQGTLHKMYLDFEVELPYLTELMLSRAILCVPILGILATVVPGLVIPRRRLAKLWLALMLVLGGLLLVAYSFAVFNPMFTIIDGLS